MEHKQQVNLRLVDILFILLLLLMTKFLLVIQIKLFNALHGDCLPKQNVNTYDSWFNCAKSGVYETLELMDLIGEDLINRNKIFISFSCTPQNEIKKEIQWFKLF